MRYLILLVLFSYQLYGQIDTLITTNNQIIAGEIKELSKGVIQIETDYSDSDFEIEWNKIKAIKSDRKFTISLVSGTRLLGTINGNSDSLIIKTKTITLSRHNYEVIRLEEYNENFLDRLSASIGVGVNISKANNLRQLNTRSSLGYFTQNWKADAAFDAVYSQQDSADQTKRIDSRVTYQYFLGGDWFAAVSSDFLENDEQKIKLRTTPKFGFGYFIINTNKVYLTVDAGISGNFEQYTDPAVEARNESETFFNTELNMFDFGDLSLLTNAIIYKSFTIGNRIRTDFKIDLKYDILGTDFYIKLGYTLNYDNQPIEGAQSTDYVIQTTFGWDL